MDPYSHTYHVPQIPQGPQLPLSPQNNGPPVEALYATVNKPRNGRPAAPDRWGACQEIVNIQALLKNIDYVSPFIQTKKVPDACALQHSCSFTPHLYYRSRSVTLQYLFTFTCQIHNNELYTMLSLPSPTRQAGRIHRQGKNNTPSLSVILHLLEFNITECIFSLSLDHRWSSPASNRPLFQRVTLHLWVQLPCRCRVASLITSMSTRTYLMCMRSHLVCFIYLLFLASVNRVSCGVSRRHLAYYMLCQLLNSEVQTTALQLTIHFIKVLQLCNKSN